VVVDCLDFLQFDGQLVSHTVDIISWSSACDIDI
jgi:hypothetical protein